MLPTQLKPLQIQEAIKAAIDLSMMGNEGIACVHLRKAFPGLSHQLNIELIEIELNARKAMRAAIEKHLNCQS